MKAKWMEENIPDLSGKVAIVTGANRGIGYATALALAGKGAAVILACRSRGKGEAVVREITRAHPGAEAEFMRLDLCELASVHSFAGEFTARYHRLDILVNNAAVMYVSFEKTVDGFERQFATNHLGHFALTGLLLGHILLTPHARVVTASSWGHLFGELDFEDINGEKKYDPAMAYADSKLANILFTYELQRRFDDAGVEAIAAAVHPGWTATDLPAGWTADDRRLDWRVIRWLNPLIGQKPEMGALPTLYAAAAPGVQGGGYYGPGGWGGLRGYPTRLRSGDRSYDTVAAERLWRLSEELTGVEYHWYARVEHGGAGQ